MTQSFVISAHIPAPIDTVWKLVSHHEGFRDWTLLLTSKLKVQGSPHPDGVGAVRFLGAGPVGAIERVTQFDPPYHLAYELVRGLPIKGYVAHVNLKESPSGSGTDLVWTGAFQSAPGPTAPLFNAVLKAMIGHFIRGVKSAAAKG